MIGLKTRPSSLLRKLEATTKKWRGLVRWYMQGHTSMRGEVVVHIVGERFGRVNRVDNLVASWRRAIARILFKKDHQQGGHEGVQQGGVQQGALHPGNHQGGQDGVPTHSKRHDFPKNDLSKLKRATWIAIGSTNFYMDVQVMHENFDVAKAKMWAEVASAVDATMCSHTEPALPVDIGPSLAAPQIPPRSKHEPRESPSQPRASPSRRPAHSASHAGQQHGQHVQHAQHMQHAQKAQHDPKPPLPQQKRSAQLHASPAASPAPSHTSRVVQLS